MGRSGILAISSAHGSERSALSGATNRNLARYTTLRLYAPLRRYHEWCPHANETRFSNVVAFGTAATGARTRQRADNPQGSQSPVIFARSGHFWEDRQEINSLEWLDEGAGDGIAHLEV